MKKLLLLLLCAALQHAGIAQDTEVPYDAQPHRPLIHFSPRANWMNDPNGLVYYDGEYHLFYQYYPDSTVWGPMHWGHAVSTDLVHWQHLPIALAPDEKGYIFSGSAVVDANNTAGFKKGKEAPLVAVFTYFDPVKNKAGTHDDQTQGIAYSNDRGRTWTKYAGNPVIPNPEKRKDFRDPKVFWYAPGNHWSLVLAAGDRVLFYTSANLKDWTYTGEFGYDRGAHGGVWECPDLFPMRVDGEKEEKWVLLVSINPGGPNGGSATQYFTGHFDGKTFVSDQKKEEVLWLDYGRDNYAGVTFFNAPEGKRLLIGWMSNWDYAQVVPTHPWRSAMTLPRELKLEKTPNGYRLKQDPVHALKILRGNPYKILQSSLHKKASGAIAFDTPQEFQITLNLKKTNATEWGIKLYSERGDTLTVGYDVVGKRYFSDRTQAGDHAFSPAFATKRHYAPRLTDDPTMECRLFIDRSSVEWFADDGLTAMTELYFARGVFNRMTVYMKGDVFDVEDVESWPLNSVWKE